MKKLIKMMMTIVLTLVVQSVYAAPLTIPNTFTANSPAIAADVNANFSATAAAVNDIEARLAALEAVTDTNNSVNTLQKAAGNWAIISNTFDSVKPGRNFVEIRREVSYGTMTINANGSFSLSFTGGNDLTVGLKNIEFPFVDPYGNTIMLYDQDVQYVDIASTLSTVTGTFTATGNSIIANIPAANMNLNGFISQNGQVMVMKGDNGGPNGNSLLIMVKIN